jgi:hypothetical protein
VEHVVGTEQSQRQILHVAFLFDGEVDFPEVGKEVVDLNQPVLRLAWSQKREYTSEVATRTTIDSLFHDLFQPLFIAGYVGVQFIVYLLETFGLVETDFWKWAGK